MTGGMPISYSVDHCGPICSSTENIARLLTAIAGPDPHDPRTINARVGNYMDALTKDEGIAHCAPAGGFQSSGQRRGHQPESA